MAYNNEPIMPNKFLKPDGSIVTFDGAEVYPPSDKYADIYRQMQWQAAKWLLPDGSIVAALPIYTEALDRLYVPLTRKINNKELSEDINLTPDDIGIQDALSYRGDINCATNPNFPAANAGDVYIVSAEGKIGGATGTPVFAGDTIVCKVDESPEGDYGTVGVNWNILGKNYGGIIYVKALWFEIINSGTSGTLTPPTEGEVVLDQWAAGIDALASQVSSSIPTFTSPLTVDGDVITATINAAGEWSLSATPASYPVAVVYVYKTLLGKFDIDYSIGGLEYIHNLDIAASILAAETETPVEADSFGFVQATTGTLKKVLYSTLKTLFIPHSLATAANDFIVASGAGVFVKKTLAETLTILGKGAASGLATLNGSSLVVENPANATSTATASKIPIADESGKLDTWVSDATTAVKGKLVTAGNAKAIAGTDTASAVTPDDLKFVLDRRIQQYYGVSWDESADTYVRTGSTAGQTCGVTLADAFLPVHRRMRGCVVKDDGTVNYYLCATNWAYKEDGTTASDLTGTDGQVMVEIPKFWYRYGYAGTSHTWEVSPVPLTGFKVHEMFMSDDTEKDYVYVGAYEASLYDTSAAKYVGQCHQTSVSAVFATSDDSITIATRTGWATALAVGQKLVITGTSNNNGTVTVKTIESATKITVDENLTDETAATTVIQTQTDVTDITGDKLCSVSGVCPITGGSANGTRAHFRTWAENRGGGKAANDAASAQWSQMYADANSGLQLLYLTEYASFYSQSVLGYGIAAVTDWVAYNNSNPIAKTGNGNAVGNASGNTATSAITTGAGATSVYLKYRGIENLYGHIWKFVDGYKVNNNITYLCNNFANFSDAEATTNYTNPTDVNGAAITMHNADGYQGTLELTGRAFMPASITGDAADKKITDYYYQGSGWRVVFLGGSANSAASAGAFYLNAYYVLAYVLRYIGGRLVLRK